MLLKKRNKRRSFMPSFDKIAKAFLEELRQTNQQMNSIINNQETLAGQNASMIELLKQIKTNTAQRKEQE